MMAPNQFAIQERGELNSVRWCYEKETTIWIELNLSL